MKTMKQPDVGTVKHISMGDRYGEGRSKNMAEITVQYGEDPKPAKGKAIACVPMPDRSSITVPVSLAKGLSIGDRVRITITKV